ncbi:NAD(P)H dehydrogenase (quinone) [Sphingomonas sp. BE270]|jgi:NAD(P)H dehydrogenase (quinone)|uniref:NAD(P)H-dependent oxidoreductase n=1 Tax=Sphingomonas sp. BE270 TaxID=2817726 RepID=UPI00286354C2|nr:NAD(P)H-dependent oxidoreductase [Sphingomonas sp. BE270]MDR7256412.1 NAD(P)H dehydrogenase (quinone) [Sphingomonas sp. BE270]
MSHQPTAYRPRHVVVLAHPEPGGFNGLVADAYCETVRSCGQEAIIRDLYAMGFDPALKASERPGKQGFALSQEVITELDTIRSSDVFVAVYPIWFGMPPAMMVGYIQRVLGAGVTARQVQNRDGDTVTRDKRLVVISTSGNSKAWLNHEHQIQSLRTIMGEYLVNAFGFRDYEDLHFGETVEGLDQLFVDQLLADVDRRARSICAAVSADRPSDAAD